MPGVQQNELFWTMPLPDNAFRVGNGGRVARLKISGLPLVDTYVFGGHLNVPVLVDVDVVWRARGVAQSRGLGAAGNAADFTAWEGEIVEAVAGGTVSGWEPSLSFRSDRLNSRQWYASMGHERNGVFLS